MQFHVKYTVYKQHNIRFLNEFINTSWYNLADIAKANNVSLDYWQNLPETVKLAAALEEMMNHEAIVNHNDSGPDEMLGVWAPKAIALDFAKFCGIDFYVWACNNFGLISDIDTPPLNNSH